MNCSTLIAQQLKLQKNLKSEEEIKSENWANRGITDLKGIETLRKLETLNLRKNLITDITLLENLGRLLNLNISGNQISCLNPLRFCVNMTSLNASDNKIVDIEQINRLNELKKLVNVVINGNPVCQQPGFKRFFLIEFYEQLQSVSFITAGNDKEQLWDCDLETGKAKIGQIYQNQAQLKEFNLNLQQKHKKYKNLQFFEDLPVKSLSIQFDYNENELIGLQYLVKKLDELRCHSIIDSNKLFESFEKTDIKSLRFVTNEEALPSLHCFVKLKSLDVQNSGLKTVIGLHWCQCLTELYLYNTKLDSLEGIERNKNLEIIDISNCDLKSIEQLYGFGHLTTLYAGTNKIQNILPLRECNVLQNLYLGNNPFSDAEQLSILEKFPLKEIDLEECPVFNDPNSQVFIQFINDKIESQFGSDDRGDDENEGEEKKKRKQKKQLKSPFQRPILYNGLRQVKVTQEKLQYRVQVLQFKNAELQDQIEDMLLDFDELFYNSINQLMELMEYQE